MPTDSYLLRHLNFSHCFLETRKIKYIRVNGIMKLLLVLYRDVKWLEFWVAATALTMGGATLVHGSLNPPGDFLSIFDVMTGMSVLGVRLPFISLAIGIVLFVCSFRDVNWRFCFI